MRAIFKIELSPVIPNVFKIHFYKNGAKISWLQEYFQILSRKIETLFRRDNICKKPCNHEILAPFLEKMNFRHHTRQAPFELH